MVVAWMVVALAALPTGTPAGDEVAWTFDTRGRVQAGRVTREQQRAVDAYVAELARVTAARNTSLEPLLAAAYRVQDLLMGVSDPQDQPRPSVDELLPEELARVTAQLNGIDIHIGDTIHVLPDPEVLLSLARSKGRTVDIEFFALLDRAYAPSGWPVWIERTGPESGCVDFTSGELVDLFWAWRRFQAANPRRYASAVGRQLREMEEDLLSDQRQCAQDRRLVARQLRRLLSLIPRDPLAPKIGDRLAAMSR